MRLQFIHPVYGSSWKDHCLFGAPGGLFVFSTKRLEVSRRALRSSAYINTSLQVELSFLKYPFPGIFTLNPESDTVSKYRVAHCWAATEVTRFRHVSQGDEISVEAFTNFLVLLVKLRSSNISFTSSVKNSSNLEIKVSTLSESSLALYRNAF